MKLLQNICFFLLLNLLLLSVSLMACDADKPSDHSINMPVNLTMKINHDSTATNDCNLRVYIDAENTHWMQIGLDAGLNDAEWEDFDTLKIITAPPLEGLVFVYGRFATQGGGTTGVVSDDIYLDLSAHIDTLTAFADSEVLLPGDVVEFTMVTGENGDARVSFSSLNLNTVLTSSSVGRFQGSLTIPYGLREEDVISTGYFTDEVGNQAEPVVAERRFSVRGPELNPYVITRYNIDGVLGFDIWFSGGYVFVCDTHAVHPVDVGIPTSPELKKSIPTGRWNGGLTGTSAFLYIPYRFGMSIISIDPPQAASEVSRVRFSEFAYDVAVDNNFAYVASTSCGLLIFDIQNNSNPILITRFLLASGGELICLDGTIAYVISGEMGFAINVADSENPRILSSFNISGNPNDLLIYRGYLYIATTNDGVLIVDIQDVYNPSVIARHPNYGSAYALGILPPFLFIGGNGFIKIANITEPDVLAEVAVVEDVGVIEGLFVSETLVYASGHSVLTIVELYHQN